MRGLRITGIYSHFARADEEGAPGTREQLDLFLRAVTDLDVAGYRFEVRHIANSAGALALDESHLDMVRSGIAAYGYYPSRHVPRRVGLRPALSLVSAVARIHDAPPGSGVGYGHDFRGSRLTRVALVPIGYGDGLPRSLGLGQGRVLIRGVSAPIVGRVSMDQVTVDATDVPRIALGDEVVLIGSSRGRIQSADDVALQAGTISYDILSGLLPRVPRVYVRDGRVLASL
jgi:alanine racemase